MSETLNIEVLHSDKAYAGDQKIFVFNCDVGALAMPDHIKIGGQTWDGEEIKHYDHQVDEYDIWLGQQIEDQNMNVLTALDFIYQKAVADGVILTTFAAPFRNNTHADKIRYQIMELAQQL